MKSENSVQPLIPLFISISFSLFQELRNAQNEMQRLTSQWYSEVRESPDTSDVEVDFQPKNTTTTSSF